MGDVTSASRTADSNASSNTTLSLTNADAPEDVVDLLFMVDTTGSMSDELEYLKVELSDVISNVAASNAGVRIRLSCNYYRDEGDTYVVRSFPFTEDVTAVQSQISAQRASGGGDYPEAVHSGISNAVYEHTWSESARARLLFLVLDAPPHDDQAVKTSLQKSIHAAAAMGVRVIPIAASGVNVETEFLLRAFALVTGGTYIFLTDNSGIGDEHLEPTIGDFEVRYLNELLVEVILRSMTNAQGEAPRT